MTEQVWQTPRTIYVKSKNSQRKWKFPSDTENSQVDYVPNFGAVQFFRWKGYWLDVSRLQAGVPYEPQMGEFEQTLSDGPPQSTSIALRSVAFRTEAFRLSILNYFSIYTRDMSVLFAFVEECRLKYLENT
jgi:mitochondrial chaperone BCS1